MKKLLFAASCILLGFVLGVAWVGSASYVGAVTPPTATSNGDTNGDASIDISDAVYLLNFLFSGGSDIAQIECAQSPRSALVATNVSRCFGQFGDVDCAAPVARGQDGFYRGGCPIEGRFIGNEDGTVMDNCTGLMWTKKNIDVDGDFELGPTDMLEWLDAVQFAEDMIFAGHSDWRVPNINELFTVFDFGIDTPGFPLVHPPLSFSRGWSSTPSRFGGGGAAYRINVPSTGGCDSRSEPIVISPVAEAQFVVAVRGPIDP